MTDWSSLYDPKYNHVFTVKAALKAFEKSMKEYECKQQNKKKDNEEDPKDLLEVKPLSSVN